MDRKILAAAAAVATAAVGLWFFLLRQPEDKTLTASLDSVTAAFRRIIVLMDGAESLDEATRQRSLAAGRLLFRQKRKTLDDLSGKLAGNARGIRQLVRYLGSNAALHDADKLAFLDLMEELDTGAGTDSSLKAVHDNLQSIHQAYREEVTRIFSQFATRGAGGTREKWDAYVASLKKLFTRDQVLGEFGNTLPEEPAASMRGGNTGGQTEIFGNDFARKTVALTFDDGPHPKYTEQVLALLRKYGIQACFFELGSGLGTVDHGEVKLGRTADVARKVLDAGHVLANHSYSHPVLSKLTEDARNQEIENTDLLLEKVTGRKTELFRAPYGARNQSILQRITADGLTSVMWNIDSLDWADPIPESIAMRVLHELNKSQKGIVLFHDIHKQSVMALSPVIEELMRQDYTFLGFNQGKFVKSAVPASVERSGEPAPPAAVPGSGRSLYRESWAVIIGVNDYQRWPKLSYAVNDANGVEEALVSRFGFKRENIRRLQNGEATRQRIMEVLGDEFTDSRKVSREDRVFVFFAGHGSTRKFEDGRQLGFIVPVDADPANSYSTAISMTSLREAADMIPAKHIYFVMDSCYSGLALTRGIGAYSKDKSYLDEITRRTARQILTAGGADQQVADDGPNGHSVFTWALLEGLQGKADLDGNGFITASELGAYVSPIVASFAKQTPSVGSMIGSEGGEFVFELQPQPLTAQSPQYDAQSMRLSEKLTDLEREIAAKQAQLLQLQQSVQAEAARLSHVKASAAAATPPRGQPKTLRAYDLDRQGQELYREKKYDQALEKFKAAVEMKPGDPVLLNNLGFIYFAMERYPDALVWLQKTLALDPRRKEAHLNLGDTLVKLGRNSEAKQHYQQFLELYPASKRAEELRKLMETL